MNIDSLYFNGPEGMSAADMEKADQEYEAKQKTFQPDPIAATYEQPQQQVQAEPETDDAGFSVEALAAPQQEQQPVQFQPDLTVSQDKLSYLASLRDDDLFTSDQDYIDKISVSWRDVNKAKYYVKRSWLGMAASGLESGYWTARQGGMYADVMEGSRVIDEAFKKEDAAIDERMKELQNRGGLDSDIIWNASQILGTMAGALWEGKDAAAAAAPVAFIPGANVTAGAAAALGGAIYGTFRIEGGNAYKDLLKSGVPEDKARMLAAGVGVVNSLIEVAGLKLMGKAFRPFLGKVNGLFYKNTVEKLGAPGIGQILLDFSKAVGTGATTESATEVMQELVSIGAEEAGKHWTGEESTNPQEVFNRLWDIAYNTMAGVAGLTVLGIPAAGLRYSRRAEHAEQVKDAYGQILQATKEMKSVKEDPETVAAVINVDAEQAGAPDVYVDAADFKEALQQAGISREDFAKVAPEIDAQLDEAAAKGGDIVMKSGDFATKFVETNVGEALLPHIRTSQEDLSAHEYAQLRQESRKALKDIQRDIKDGKTLSEQRTDRIAKRLGDDMAKAVQDGYDQTYETLTKAGMPEAEARANAALTKTVMVNLAAQTHISAQKLWYLLPQIQARVAGGGQSGGLNQGARKNNPAKFLGIESRDWNKRVHSLTEKPIQKLTMLKHTPLVLSLAGADFSELRVSSHLFDGMFPGSQKTSKDHSEHLEMTADVIGQIPGAIADPVAIFTDPEHGERSRTVLIDVQDASGKPVAISLNIRAEDGGTAATMIKTAFGLDAEKLFSDGRRRLLYVNKQKRGALASLPENPVRGSSSPSSADHSAADAASVLTEEDLRKAQRDNPTLYQYVSTALPSEAQIKAGEEKDPRYFRQWASLKKAMENKEFFKKLIAAMKAVPGIKGAVGRAAKPETVAERMVEHLASNLAWLYDAIPADVRDRARRWYDGGHIAVKTWAKRYGLRERQTAAIIAIFSPQNGWFNNMTNAERLLDIYFSARRSVPNAEHEAALKGLCDKPSEKIKFEDVAGKTLEELVQAKQFRAAALWVRTYDAVHNSIGFNILTPEGGVGGRVLTSKGEEYKASFFGNDAIGKALSVIADGSVDNISQQIGDQFKVRNFYNNLYDPQNTNAATIDTHAVAAALLSPMSSKSQAVLDNFGSIKNARSGQNGTYPIYFEAYRRAAERAGISPREMQSITWEAVRVLFKPEQKRKPKKGEPSLQEKVDAVWKQFDAGKLSIDEARQQIYDLAGGFDKLSWEDTPFNQDLESTYDRSGVQLYDDIVQPEMEPMLALEVAPDPNDKEAKAKWETLDNRSKLEILNEVLPGVIEEVAALTHTRISEPHTQIGGYYGDVNYSVSVDIADGGNPVEVAGILAKILRQDSVMVLSDNKYEGTEETKIVRFRLPKGFTEDQLSDLYKNRLDKLIDKNKATRLDWNGKEEPNRLFDGMSVVDGEFYSTVRAEHADQILEELTKIWNELGIDPDVVIDDGFKAFVEPAEESKDANLNERRVSEKIWSDTDVSSLRSETDKKVSAAIERAAARQAERTAAGAAARNPGGTLKQVSVSHYGNERPVAPNGKPSNLTAEQWRAVRTPEFKAWFGDWENDPEHASKALDENGEPKVYYHGGNGIKEDFSRGAHRGWMGVAYFSDSREVAGKYAILGGIDPDYETVRDYGEAFNGARVAGNPAVKDRKPHVTRAFINARAPLDPKDVSTEDLVAAIGDKLWETSELEWYLDEKEESGEFIEKTPENLVAILDELGTNEYFFGSIENDGNSLINEDGEYEAGTGFLWALSLGCMKEYMDAAGYDSIIYGDNEAGGNTLVVKDAHQIKHATQNSGEFGRETTNILRQVHVSPDRIPANAAPSDPLVAIHELNEDNLAKSLDLGGFAVPSIGITKAETPYTDFGDIALIGTSDLIDPASGTPVWSQDAYTTRFPNADGLSEKAKGIGAELTAEADRLGIGDSYVSPVTQLKHKAVGAENFRREFARDPAAKSLFLKEQKGIEVSPVMEQQAVAYRVFPEDKPYVVDHRFSDIVREADTGPQVSTYDIYSSHEAELTRALIEIYDGFESKPENSISESIRRAKETGEKLTPLELITLISEVRESAEQNQSAPEVDAAATRSRIDDEISKYRDEYDAWVEKKTEGVGEGVLRDKDGNEHPVTLENVARWMLENAGTNREWEETKLSGENVPSIRAASAHQFTSLEEIQSRRDSVVSKKKEGARQWDLLLAVNGARNDVQWAFRDSGEKFDPDLYAEHLVALTKGSEGKSTNEIEKEVRADFDKLYGKGRIPDETVKTNAEAVIALRDMVAEYFEAKPARAVKVDEFKGAVVPDTASDEIVSRLEKAGLEVVRYSGNGEYQTAIKELSERLQEKHGNVLFQAATQTNDDYNGAYNPQTNTLTLTPNADPSTFAHEMSHWFLEQSIALAQDPECDAGFRKDLDDMLKACGLQGGVAGWASAGFDVQSRIHEQFAGHTEEYLANGKAPDGKVKGFIRRLGAFIRDVYRMWKDGTNEAVRARYRQQFGEEMPDLSPEVRRMLDRMLVGADALEMREQEEALQPLFAEKPDGMTDEEWAEVQAMYDEAGERALEAYMKAAGKDEKWYASKRGKMLRENDKAAKEIRDRIRAEVAREVNSRPEFVALDIIASGSKSALSESFKLSPESLQMLGFDKQQITRMKAAGLVKEGGIWADELLTRLRPFGVSYSGPRELARALLDAADKETGSGKSVLELLQASVSSAITDNLRMSPESLKALGFNENQIAKLRTAGLVKHGGIDADTARQLLQPFAQFKSAKKMVQALLHATGRKEFIEEETARRCMRDHSEVFDQKKVDQIISDALKDELRSRMMASEIKYLTKSQQPPRVILAAAKLAAHEQLNRTAVDDAKPSVYQALAARAGRRAMQSIRGRSYEQAAYYRRQQLVYQEMARMATQLQASLRGFRDMRKRIFGNDKKMAATYDTRIVAVARALLTRRGLGVTRKGEEVSAETWLARIEQYDPELYKGVSDILARHPELHEGDRITAGELLSVFDDVKALMKIAREARIVTLNGRTMDLEQAVGELVNQAKQSGVKPYDKPTKEAATKKTLRHRLLLNAKAQLTRVESWCIRMDGGEPGPFSNYIYRPIAAAAAQFRVKNVEYQEKLAKILKANAERWEAEREIEAPELGYTFRRKSELIGLLLHIGNASNYQKLVLGGAGGKTKWGELLTMEGANGERVQILDDRPMRAFLDRAMSDNTITKEDMDAVQAIWDLLEETKPLAQKAMFEYYGYYFDEVEAQEVVTPWGTYRGGYVPAATDVTRVQESEKQQEKDLFQDADMSNTMPVHQPGFSKARSEFYNKPLSFDVSALGFHLTKVLKFAMLAPTVKQVQRILKDHSFADAIGEQDPTWISQMLEPWLSRAASQQITTPAGQWGSVLSKFRALSGMSLMAANIQNALQQLTGFSITASQVKASSLALAMRQVMSDRKGTYEAVIEKSAFMRARLNDLGYEYSNEIERIGKTIDTSKPEQVRDWINSHAYFAQTIMQNCVDIPSWLAAYNEAIEKGRSEEDAVADADSVVRRTQSSFDAEAVSRVETGHPLKRAILVFYNYFNMQLNGLYESYTTKALRGKYGAFAADVVLITWIPAVLSALIYQAFAGFDTGDDDDWEGLWILRLLIGSEVQNLTAMLPFIGSVINVGATTIAKTKTPAGEAVKTVFGDNPFNDKIVSMPAASLFENAWKGAAGTIKWACGGDVKPKTVVRNLTDTVTLVTGVPVTGLKKPLGYLAGVAAGDIEPEDPSDVIRGLISGKDVNE